MKALLNLREAADTYSISYTVLYEAVRSEALPAIRPTRTWLVAPDDVMAYLRGLDEKRREDES